MRKNKIRILHVAQAAGGVDRYIRMLLKYLDKEKFENILVCSQDFREEDYRGLVDSFEQIEMTRAIGASDLKAIKAVRKLIRKYNPDIVYAHSSKAGAIARVADIDYCKSLLYKFRIDKVKAIVPGGETGQLSIYNGLKAAKEIAGDEKSIVLIHDGVRPLINDKVITDNINSVKEHGSAITTAVVKETILVVDPETSTIDYVPSRNNSRVARAPQSFWLDDILSAHEKMLTKGITNCIDSCTMMQECGFNLHLVDGPGENIKITTPEDFYTMRAILEAKENAQIYGFDE